MCLSPKWLTTNHPVVKLLFPSAFRVLETKTAQVNMKTIQWFIAFVFFVIISVFVFVRVHFFLVFFFIFTCHYCTFYYKFVFCIFHIVEKKTSKLKEHTYSLRERGKNLCWKNITNTKPSLQSDCVLYQSPSSINDPKTFQTFCSVFSK